MKNYAGYTQVYAGFQGAGRTVYVKNEMVDIVQQALKDYRKSYHLTTIFRQVVGLNANPLQGKSLNPAGDARTIASGNVTLKYYMFNGVVLIQLLAIGHGNDDRRVGLYSVAYDPDDKAWLPSKSSVDSLNGDHQWRSEGGTAHYAAVSGRFDNLDDASDRLVEHVVGGYSKAKYLIPHDAEGPYSVFWVEKGQHKKPEAAQQLASVIQHGTQNKLPVNWLVHGEGAHTFKNMSKLLKATAQAENQNVYFSNPSIDSENQLKQLCADAGMNFVGLNTSYRDLRRWSTLKNVGAEIGKAAAIGLGSSGTVSAADGLRPLGGGGATKIVENGVDALLSGNHFATLSCLVATGVIVAGMVKKSKTIGAGISCTFGKGNQRWYVSDKDLLQS
ncbi:hypothetical protein [Marinimicrobium locisalis]|uniref:hypothetical protein n=1 Tax=Marinimicrobium locisalis TaxID=546022 RepID=UPI003221B753